MTSKYFDSEVIKGFYNSNQSSKNCTALRKSSLNLWETLLIDFLKLLSCYILTGLCMLTVVLVVKWGLSKHYFDLIIPYSLLACIC